jgi:hypothetical protein
MANSGPDPSKHPHKSPLIPKGVALAMGAGLAGLVVGGALVAFTAAVAAPAIKDRIDKARERARKPPAAAD